MIEMNIPHNHPYFRWLHNYRHEAMDTGGLMRHGVLTLKLGGIEQRYDFVSVETPNHVLDTREAAVLAFLLAELKWKVENPSCCEGGPQWGHAWDCPI